MKKKVYLAAIIIAALAVSSGCKKGDPGPAGTNGTDGNANVTNTAANITSWTHVGDTTLAGNYWEAVVSVPDITATVLSSGAILVYYKDAVIADYHQLPMTMNYPAYTRSYNVVITATTGQQVKIQVGDSDGNSLIPVNASVRVVVIPSRRPVDNVSYDNLPYEEMLQLYHLDNYSK